MGRNKYTKNIIYYILYSHSHHMYTSFADVCKHVPNRTYPSAPNTLIARAEVLFRLSLRTKTKTCHAARRQRRDATPRVRSDHVGTVVPEYQQIGHIPLLVERLELASGCQTYVRRDAPNENRQNTRQIPAESTTSLY